MWVKSLRSKFNNEKCRNDKQHPRVVARKKRKTDLQEISKNPCTEMFEVPYYRPLIEEHGEDETKLASHISWMQEEYKKCSKNFKGIGLRMELTFKHRRRLLFSNKSPHSASDILQQYPCFRMESEVCKLFQIL